MSDELCRHCGSTTGRLQQPGRRGLCHRCYQEPAIREQYPLASGRHKPSAREPTEEELESIIKEQEANLPPWWSREMPRDGSNCEEPADVQRAKQEKRMRVAVRLNG
jgi:hypothetical protein